METSYSINPDQNRALKRAITFDEVFRVEIAMTAPTPPAVYYTGTKTVTFRRAKRRAPDFLCFWENPEGDDSYRVLVPYLNVTLNETYEFNDYRVDSGVNISSAKESMTIEVDSYFAMTTAIFTVYLIKTK